MQDLETQKTYVLNVDGEAEVGRVLRGRELFVDGGWGVVALRRGGRRGRLRPKRRSGGLNGFRPSCSLLSAVRLTFGIVKGVRKD